MCDAAQIKVISDNGLHCPVVRVKGTIKAGDGPKFAAAILPLKRAIVEFEGPGGATADGLFIGKLIHAYGFWTTVRPRKECASSCALAWIGGSKRFIEQNARVGFHTAYIEKKGKLSESGQANAIIGAYLTRLGFSESAVAFATSAGPKGMKWLSAKEPGNVDFEVIFGEPRNVAKEQKSVLPILPAATSKASQSPEQAVSSTVSSTKRGSKQVYDRITEEKSDPLAASPSHAPEALCGP